LNANQVRVVPENAIAGRRTRGARTVQASDVYAN